MTVYLRTPRLVLRQFTEDDLDALVALDNDPGVLRYLDDAPPSRERVRDEILPAMLRWHERSDSFGYWVATAQETDDVLGWFELQPVRDAEPEVVELGYRLRTAAWGRGFASEGAQALVDKGFRALGVRRVVATTMAVNSASRRVMEKAGLRYVRTFHEEWSNPLPGTEHGEVEYALDRERWEEGL